MNPKSKAIALKVKHLSSKKEDPYKKSLAKYLEEHKNDEFKEKKK